MQQPPELSLPKMDGLSETNPKASRPKRRAPEEKRNELERLRFIVRMYGTKALKAEPKVPSPYVSVLRFHSPELRFFATNEKLGSGNTGVVKKAYPVNNSGEGNAIDFSKCFARKRIIVKRGQLAARLAALEKQISACWHFYGKERANYIPKPLVVPVKPTSRIFVHPDFTNIKREQLVKIYFILPFASGQSVDDIIENQFDSMEYHQRLTIALAIVNEVLRLHSAGYSHGELSAYNILFDEKTKQATLIDFESVNCSGCILSGDEMIANPFYAPREYFESQGKTFNITQTQAWDKYILGVTLTKVFFPARLVEMVTAFSKEQNLNFCSGENQFDWDLFMRGPERFCVNTDKEQLKSLLLSLMKAKPEDRLQDLNVLKTALEVMLNKLEIVNRECQI